MKINAVLSEESKEILHNISLNDLHYSTLQSADFFFTEFIHATTHQRLT